MKPTLLILAAGMGSRYGGLKQLDRVGPSGETIIDYSVYDAIRAGFGKVVFVIKEAIEKEFKEAFIDRLGDKIAVDRVFQEIWMVPEGISIPAGRTKPWGTGHAVLMGEEKIGGPFAVINADDFYGRGAFAAVAEYYREWTAERGTDYCMVGYPLANTLSEFGSVSRGICRVDDGACLTGVRECTHIVRQGKDIVYKDDHEQMVPMAGDTIVSMNCWGFTPSFFGFLKDEFGTFIKKNADDLKAEFYIPGVVNDLIGTDRASLKVLRTGEQWFGMTYREDREKVVMSIRDLVSRGVYPEKLWG